MEAEAIRQTFKGLFKNIEGENHERFAARTAFCLLVDQGLVPEIGYYRKSKINLTNVLCQQHTRNIWECYQRKQDR